jgi:Zn-dependent protease
MAGIEHAVGQFLGKKLVKWPTACDKSAMPTRKGAIRIFRLLGIDVFLHWSWFLIVLFDIQIRRQEYNSYAWNALETLSLFGIVLLHEFGHALACRQVGGKANQIILWPLGGVAYVSPPQRPGAMLWSIAAGPLVNVVLVPILSVAAFLAGHAGWDSAYPNLYHYINAIWWTNLIILIFNMLPIYPLDGGQIFRSLLWFFVGRANSLMVASALGFFGVAGMAVLAYFSGQTWFWILAAFAGLNCWTGFKQSQMLLSLEKAPRRPEFHCPVCKESPPIGKFWRCSRCGNGFDTFETQTFCPNCNAEYPMTACPYCFNSKPMAEWRAFQTPPPVPPQGGV